MSGNPLREVQRFGQSIWLDFISRELISSGSLEGLIKNDGLRGITSNPSIFDKSIEGSRDYDDAIKVLALEGKSVPEIYQALTVADIQNAADVFRPTYERTDGKHGYVSLEVNPHLAHDTRGTIAEAQNLWSILDRPNVFIKVPATQEGLPAITQLISEGINVNVTLLFGLPRYRQVALAYIEGLEARLARGAPVARVASVASFFLSRIDVLVDPLLEKLRAEDGSRGQTAEGLKGRVAIASARSAYQIYREIFGGNRFQRLADRGAATQRVLWASTSTKNPAYSDVKYVEALIGPETINTLPLETLDAYRDHGNPAPRLETDLEEAANCFELLREIDIDIDDVTRRLEDEGIEKFNKPYDHLMETLRKKCASVLDDH